MLSVLIASAVLLGVTPAQAIEPHRGVWVYSDSDGSLALRLDADGTCEISSFARSSGTVKREPCRYWVHGSRIKLRTKNGRDGEGFNLLDIEHLRESNTLVIHGDKPRVLRRGWISES